MTNSLKNQKAQRLTLRVSEEFLEQIKRKAKENELSLSAYVRTVHKNEIKKG